MKTTLTPQAALDATKRTQYANKDILATFPPATDLPLEFFTLDKYVTESELDKEYESRGLAPASPFDLCTYDLANPDKMDEMQYVATQWKDGANWNYAAFRRWDGERRVCVYRGGCRWRVHWWFAGVRKSSDTGPSGLSDPLNFEERLARLEKIVAHHNLGV